MNFESYQMQILVVVGKGCRPNSPKPARAWMQVKPISGLPEFGNALSALLRAEARLSGEAFAGWLQAYRTMANLPSRTEAPSDPI